MKEMHQTENYKPSNVRLGERLKKQFNLACYYYSEKQIQKKD